LQWLRTTDEVAEAAAEMGYDGVDITVRPYPGHVGPMRVMQDLPGFVNAIRQHVPERLSIPGFRRGRRFVAMEGGPEFCTLYEADGPEDVSGKAYLERLNAPTEWTQRMMPAFRNMARSVCRVAYSAGVGEGGFMVTCRFGFPPPGNRGQPRTFDTGFSPRFASFRVLPAFIFAWRTSQPAAFRPSRRGFVRPTTWWRPAW
jgi:hypothetical protein